MSIREDLLKRRTELSASKQALLKKRLQRTETDVPASSLPPITRRPPDTTVVPLSFAQERLWSLQELEPENTAYNELITVRISGPVNFAAMTGAVRSLVQRHELLRTTFSCSDAGIVQQIDPDLHTSFDFPITELELFPGAQREQEVRHFILHYAQQPFALTEGILWRLLLLRVSEEEHILLAVIHHLICDSWSMSLFARDLALFYSALCQGEVASLPALPFQYADYTLWQRDWLQGAALQKQQAYWREHLAGLPADLGLLTDHPRPARATYQGKRLMISLPSSLRHGLTTLAHLEGMTPFMILSAALAIVLSRYSHQQDLAIGTPIAGRIHADLEQIFGLFLNTLVLRIDLSGDPTLKQLLQRVRSTALEAYAHQDLPFEKLVEDLLHTQHSLPHSPFFQVMLSLQHMPEPQRLEHVTFAPFDVGNGGAKIDLAFLLEEKKQELGGVLEYNSDLWDQSTMERLLEHWQRTLHALVEDPQLPLSQFSLLSHQERLDG